MAFGPSDFAADAVFARQIPVVPLSAGSNGNTLLNFMRQHRGRETWVVFYRSGFEPHCVGISKYFLDPYLRKYTFNQQIGRDPDPRNSLGG
jgi:hypothetical protein